MTETSKTVIDFNNGALTRIDQLLTVASQDRRAGTRSASALDDEVDSYNQALMGRGLLRAPVSLLAKCIYVPTDDGMHEAVTPPVAEDYLEPRGYLLGLGTFNRLHVEGLRTPVDETIEICVSLELGEGSLAQFDLGPGSIVSIPRDEILGPIVQRTLALPTVGQ